MRFLVDAQLPRQMVLDFAKVEFFDANLRGLLVWLHRELSARGGRLAVCNLGEMRKHPTLITFSQIMVIVDRLDQALGALRAGSAGAMG